MSARTATTVAIVVDGERIDATPGIPLGAVLYARRPSALFCGMGMCFDCLVTVDGRTGVRACVTPVREGMRVELG